MNSLEIRLNPDQEKAVQHLNGPLLIIAGAGTGKTRVITERVAYLLDHVDGLQPENMVALTFSKRATEEMSSRIRSRLGDRFSAEVHVHTFHSFALRLVQEQSARLERQSEAQLLDNVDFWILMRRHIERLNLDVFWKNAEPGKFLSDLIEFMFRAHDELVSVADYEAYVRRLEEDLERQWQDGRLAPALEEQLKREREITRVYRAATELLSENGAQTFGDVIATAVRMLQDFPDVRQHYQNRFRAILVDEFQDTNVAQIELLDLLAQSHQNITMVGDDDQGIYKFRGASSESFILFARKFPRYQQVKLTQNYRSTRRILRVANQLISVNPDRFDPDKNLWTQKGEGKHVKLIETPEPDDEALAIAAEVERLQSEGRPLKDIAVLYRAHHHRDLLVKALRRRAIPFQVVGISVLEYPAVRDLFALARFLVKPSDNIACARLVCHPRWKLTEPEFAALTFRTADHPNRDESGRPSLYEVIQEWTQQGAKSTLKEKLTLFVEWIEALKKAIDRQTVLGALKILSAELEDRNSSRQRILEDVRKFRAESIEKPVRRVLDFVQEWQKKNDATNLKDFLEYFDFFLEARGDITEDEKEGQGTDAVRLMTVHAAKGLEFPVVFVMRLTQTYFPGKHHPSLLPFPDALRKEGQLPGDSHTHEERRLCYVALTRAQEILILTYVSKPRWKPSEFLADIQRDRKWADHDLELTRVDASGEKLADELSLDPCMDEAALRTSRLPLWALRNAPLPSRAATPAGELKLSASSMETYTTCPMQYKFDQLYKLSAGPTAALTVGSILHECVKQFFVWKKESGDFPVERLEQYLDGRWRSVGFEDEYQEKRYRESALDQLRRFYEKNIHLDVNVLEQEKTFQFPMDEVILVGRIDQMNEAPDGAVEVIDYKTGRPKDQKEADRSLQLSVYALACREFFHRPLAQLTFYNLVNGEKVITNRSAVQLSLDCENIFQIACEIQRHHFPPKKNYFCSQCNFLSVCPAFEDMSTRLPDDGSF